MMRFRDFSVSYKKLTNKRKDSGQKWMNKLIFWNSKSIKLKEKTKSNSTLSRKDSQKFTLKILRKWRIDLKISSKQWRSKEKNFSNSLIKRIKSWNLNIKNWKGSRLITLTDWRKGKPEFSSLWIESKQQVKWTIKKSKIYINRFIKFNLKNNSWPQNIRPMLDSWTIKSSNNQPSMIRKMIKSKNFIKKSPESKNNTTQ